MIKEWFWDRNINEKELRNILANPGHSKFVQLSALILSRENVPKKVFKYITKEDFVQNWLRIKKQMRKNRWNEPRIIYWQVIYEKLLEKLKKSGFRLRNKSSTVMDEICVAVGRQIREMRIKKELTQKDLAALLNISQQMLSRIESGKENISLITLKKVVKELGCEIVLKIKEKCNSSVFEAVS